MCDLLTLTLGPFRLEVLGVVIHLDAVVLRFGGDAMSGVVGQWLCGLAGASWLDPQASPVLRLLGLSGGA
jgi:hypothetical protein